MSFETTREKLASVGNLPGLSRGLEENVLLLRCRDIDQFEFVKRTETIYRTLERLYEQALPESMDEDVYLVAKEYYDASREALDSYLRGLDALLEWAATGQGQFLDRAKAQVTRGDRLFQDVSILAFEAQDSFRQTDEAILKSLGHQV